MANTTSSELYRSISGTLDFSTSNQFFQFQRGPMYATYSKLREERIVRRKQIQQEELEEEMKIMTPTPTPTKKKSKMAATSPMVACSVPDFSSVLRKEKENRRPLPSRTNLKAKAPIPLPRLGLTEVKTPSPLAASRSTPRSLSSSVRKSFSYLKEFGDVGESRLGIGSSRTGNYGVRKSVTAAATGGVRRYAY